MSEASHEASAPFIDKAVADEESVDSSRHWPRVRAAVNIFACSISGGIVAIPKSFQDASLLYGLALAVLAGITTAFSLQTLAIISKRTGGARTYGEVTTVVIGPFAGQVDLLVRRHLSAVLTPLMLKFHR